MASDTGFEQCETWDTGCCEVHITADIAYAMGRYVEVTGDTDFLFRYAAEVYVETARYWQDRFNYCVEDGQYHLLFVKGPDEYCGVTTNDFLRFIWRGTIFCWRWMPYSGSDGRRRNGTPHWWKRPD